MFRRLTRHAARRLLTRHGSRKWVWHTRGHLRRSQDIRGGVSASIRRFSSSARATWRAARGVAIPILLSLGVAAALLAAVWFLDSRLGVQWHFDGHAYDVLFETIGGVTGVFLALYFTAVSTVAATAYADVPTETRDLLVREKLGNSYVRVVAFLTAFSVGALGLHALNKGPFGLAVVVAVFGSGVAVFAFVALGRRAFQFFDPVAIASLALSDLADAVGRASGVHRPPRDANAAVARGDAKRVADALSSLIALAVERPRLGSALGALLRRVLTATSQYMIAKAAIPSRSRWFGTRYEHRQWFLSDSTALELATAASVSLQPEEVPDLGWLEVELMTPVQEVVARAAERGDFESLWLVLPRFLEVAQVAGGTFEVRAAIRWIDPLVETLKNALLIEDARQEGRPLTLRLAVAEIVAQLPMQLELALYRRIADLDASRLDSEVQAVDIASPGAAYQLSYRLGLPRRCIESLEMVARGREFEEVADVGVQTPAWYARDLVANSLLWAAHEEWRAAHEFLLGYYRPLADQLSVAGRHLEAATVRARGLEASWKLLRHIETITERDQQLRAILVLQDLQQPEWEEAPVAEIFVEFRLELFKDMAASIPHLASIPRSGSEMPDYLGEAVHRTGEACYEALARNDPDYFRAVFGPYFFGILTVADRIRPQVAQWWPQTAGSWMAAPIIDLLTISGYARIFSELNDDSAAWNVTRGLWDAWFEQEPERLQIIDAMISIERSTFALQPRAVLRTQWEMRLQQTLQALPRREASSPWDEGPVDHTSALIRALSPHDGLFMSYRPLDVFVALYLQERTDTAEFSFGVRGSYGNHLERLRDDVNNSNDEEAEEDQ